MKVSDLMTKHVATIRRDEPLSNAAQLMWDCDCGALPVLDNDERVVGMVTDRDICMASWSKDRSPSALRVSDAMSQALFHCAPHDSVAYAEGLLRSKQIRRLPVLDSEQRLQGILSLADIVRQGTTSEARTQAELAPGEITLTIAQICRPPLSAQPSV
jgi:CBS domain-containing protein